MIKAEKIQECSDKIAEKVLGCVAKRTDGDTVIWTDPKTFKEVAVLWEDDNGTHFEFTNCPKTLDAQKAF